MTTKSPEAVPVGTCDTHVHVFEPDRFPYRPDRRYTPGVATVTDLRASCERLGVERVVLVQPSVYGTDNTCHLAARAELGDIARAVVVVDPIRIGDGDLQTLREQGVVGIRLNLAVSGESRATAALDAFKPAVDRLAGTGLSVHLHAAVDVVSDLAGAISDAPVPVVLDHFGGVRARNGVDAAATRRLLDLLAAGHVWVKLSAPYRVSTEPIHADLAPVARAMIAANPHRLLWASDWPHTGGGADRARRGPHEIEPFRDVDDAADLRRLADWAGDARTYRTILADNPAALYRF
jgi:predicted TIM-barrel fold metal-dependent hydrolase